MSAPPPVPRPRRYAALTVLGSLAALLAAVAAAAGLFWTPPGDVPTTALSAWGERVALYGEGLYRRDDVFRAAGARGTDLVTLMLGVPLLGMALVLRWRGHRAASLLVAGGLAWTAYVYASLALGSVAYNELFLVYVATASASAFGLGLAIREASALLGDPAVLDRLPRRPLAAFLLASGLATTAIWLLPLLAAALAGDPPERLGHYTGRVTDALDVGVITPATLLAGVLVWQRRALGVAVTVPLLVLEALLLPMIAAQTALQVRAGVVLTPPEIIGPVAGFVVLAAGAVWALVVLLRRLADAPVPGRVPMQAALVVALLVGGALLAGGPVAAQEVETQGSEAQAAPDAFAVTRAAERFAAEAFPALADSFNVPGAVLALVRGDAVLALDGVGYANLDAQTPADPRHTLFRVGSVSKLVTATAVLQLWERGRLDLHGDVNDALQRIEVPEAFGAPVTAHALLTHTAGLDERLFPAGARDAAPDLAAYLAETLPPRIYPPGTLHLYSNHGYGLLGVLVADVTGRPFAEAVDRAMLAPLGMTRSTFRQPPPEASALATGYVRTRDGLLPLPFDYVAFTPAGSFTTTADDMARFMAFHLTGRTPDGPARGVLADSTRRLMHGPRWRAHPAMAGMGYGFFRLGLGRHPALRHRGGWPGWIAQLVLVPDLDLGLFVAVNTDAVGFVNALLEHFAADVLDGPLPPPAAVVPGLAERAGGLVGTYRLARHDHRTFGKVAALLGMPAPDLRVEAAGDSALVLASGPAVQHLYEVEPFVFVEPGLDPQRFFFETGADGRAVRLHVESASLERLGWWETAALHRVLLTACVLVLGSAVVAWLASRFRRSWREGPAALRRARHLAALAAVLFLGFVVGLAFVLVGLGPQGIFQPFPFGVRVLFVLPPVAALLGVLTVPAAVLLWRRRLGSLAGRLHYVAVALACVTTSALFAYWNLLG